MAPLCATVSTLLSVDQGLQGVEQQQYLLDDKALQHELAVGALQQAALHAVGGGQPEHQHRLGLPYPVSPVHCLQASKEAQVQHTGLQHANTTACPIP